MREQMGLSEAHERVIERIAVSAEFQAELARVWQSYLPIQQALAADDFSKARESLEGLEAQIAAVSDESLNEDARGTWSRERRNLVKLMERLKPAADINALRTEFSPFSQEIGVLAKTFGFGTTFTVL